MLHISPTKLFSRSLKVTWS